MAGKLLANCRNRLSYQEFWYIVSSGTLKLSGVSNADNGRILLNVSIKSSQCWLSFESSGEYVTCTNSFFFGDEQSPEYLLFKLLIRNFKDSTGMENLRFIDWFTKKVNATTN